ncbi:MAG: glutathione S-transferase [Candidatus Obscuribacterales bacterium]|nr:glutathione S-transferase [Steroidobacteraceae bacterium]
MTAQPILYSFRRCPYAMRARLAIAVSGQTCELREVVLRAKPHEMLVASPKGTVPILVDGSMVVDESLDIMLWALKRHDPEQWLLPERGSLLEMQALIAVCDGHFKFHLDRYKYPERYSGCDRAESRVACSVYLRELNIRLTGGNYLFGSRAALADMAIAPFVRQFAHVDSDWFAAQPWLNLYGWLTAWEVSPLYQSAMCKYHAWKSGAAGASFP